MLMDDSISGFFEPVTDYGQPDPGSFSLIHESEEGFCLLYRGERAGRFRTFKCLKPQWRESPLHVAMLRKEFELGYPLRHNNIREVYAFLDLEGIGPCMEMEWVDGVSLEEFLQRAPLPEKTFRKLAGELCDALSYLHSRQTFHRDLKPANILVTHGDPCIKLIDFGLADSSASAILKVPAGTRRYAAPEILRGAAGDARSDIYSLGVVLGQMTPRHRPVIRKCLREDPAQRFQSAAAVKDALLQRPRWPLAAVVLLAAAALLAAFLWLRPQVAAPSPLPAPLPAADTLVVHDTLPAPPQKKAPAPSRPASQTDSQADSGDEVDRIFREATDLLEGRL